MLQDIIGYSSTFFYYTNHHRSTQFKRQGYEENGSTQKEVSSSRCWCHQGEMPRGFRIMLKEIPGLLHNHQGGPLIEAIVERPTGISLLLGLSLISIATRLFITVYRKLNWQHFSVKPFSIFLLPRDSHPAFISVKL